MNKVSVKKLNSLPQDEQEFRKARRWLVTNGDDPDTNTKWVKMPLIELETKALDRLVSDLLGTVRDIKLICGGEVANSLDTETTISLIKALKNDAILKRYNDDFR